MKKYKIKRFWNSIISVPKSLYLCIRFKFLYPRNRWNDKHYTNWKLEEYLHGKPARNQYVKQEDGTFKSELLPATDGLYGKAFATTTEWIDDTEYIGDTIQSYPWFIWYKIVYFIAEYFLPLLHCIPTYTELDSMPTGWRKAFGIQMCKELKQQLKKEGKYKEFRILEIKEKFGCYDELTEVLTKDGWKYFKDVTLNDEIATLGENNFLEYHKPNEVMQYDYCGPMYKLVNRGLDILVTPNHNLYVAKGSYFYHKKNNVKVLNSYELATPNKYFGKDKRFLKTCKWDGEVPNDIFKIPDYNYENVFNKINNPKKRHYTIKGPEFEIHAFLRFLGFYVAEGYTDLKGGQTAIAYNPNDEEDLICMLLSDLNLKYHQAGIGLKRTHNKAFGLWLNENCGHLAWNKKVPDFIKNLPSEYIREFLEYLYIGDGHKASTSRILTTTSKQLADDVCELLLKVGDSFRVYSRHPHNKSDAKIQGKHFIYEINWLKLPEIEIDMSKAKHTKSFIETWEQYNGKVYCVNVQNHIIYVRRNGKGYWCGNSLRYYTNFGSKEIYDIIHKYEDLSWETCICCGKPSTKISSGWISPYCDDCFPKNTRVQEEKIDGKWVMNKEYQEFLKEMYAKNKKEV